ncbi:MAG: hypothetical protein Kow0069_15880 [Promethearchaeota archaeon]
MPSRLFILFFPGFVLDLKEYVLWGKAFLSHDNPYELFLAQAQGFLTVKFPPLYYFTVALVVATLGTTPFGFKAGYLVLDAGIVATVYYLYPAFDRVLNASEVQEWNSARSENSRWAAVYLYAFSAPTLFIHIMSPTNFLAVFFYLLAFTLLLRGHPFASGATFALAFLSEIYPFFFTIPVVLLFLTRQRYKDLAKYFTGFGAAFLAVGTPFILLDATKFAYSFLVHLSRHPQAHSAWELIKPHVRWDIFSIPGVATVSPVGMALACLAGTYFIASWVHLKKRGKSANATDVFPLVAWFLLFLPLVFLSSTFRYIYWFHTVFVVMLAPTVNLEKVRRVAAIQTSVVVALGALAAFRFSSIIFADLTVYEPGGLDEQLLALLAYYAAGCTFLVAWEFFFEGTTVPSQFQTRLGLPRYLVLVISAYLAEILFYERVEVLIPLMITALSLQAVLAARFTKFVFFRGLDFNLGGGGAFAVGWKSKLRHRQLAANIPDGGGKTSVVMTSHDDAPFIRSAVQTVLRFIRKTGFASELIVAEDGSTDGTDDILAEMAASDPLLVHLHSDERLGKGRAVERAVERASGTYVLVMDSDLSSSLDDAFPLLEAVRSGCAVALGSRFHPSSKVTRKGYRTFLSVAHRVLAKILTGLKEKDPQVGFKVLRKQDVLPLFGLVREKAWAWDTELLVLAARCGLNVVELPVTWTERKNPSKVRVLPNIVEHLVALARLRWRLWTDGELKSQLAKRFDAGGDCASTRIWSVRLVGITIDRELVGKFFRFCVAGAISFCVQAGLTWLFLHWIPLVILSTSVAVGLTQVFHFWLSKDFAFKYRHKPRVVQFLYFLETRLASILIQIIITDVASEVLGWTWVLGQLGGVLVSVLFNFATANWLVFAEPATPEEAERKRRQKVWTAAIIAFLSSAFVGLLVLRVIG